MLPRYGRGAGRRRGGPHLPPRRLLAPRPRAEEFSETLQRDGGFTFEIKTGALEIGGKRTEFARGKARFTLVRPGTDASKRLADIEAPHKLALSLTAPDGTNVAFDIALVAPGPKPSP